MQNHMLGSMIRKRLEGKVPVSILRQMTDEELAQEYHYSQDEKVRWATRERE